MDRNLTGYTLLIQKLDKFIRKYYLNQLIRGILYSIRLVLGLFLVFNLLESQFYFSTVVRKIFFFSFIGISLFAFSFWIVNPLLKYLGLGKSLSYEKAATIIGDHFGNVKDKLLNILQLQKEETTVHSDLLAASIEQKTQDIKLVPFKTAIDLKNNRKYLKYTLPPFLILIGILFINANIITDSTKRIIDNNTEYIPDAPFEFIVQNGDAQILQYTNYTIAVKAQGTSLPNEVFIEIDNFKYRLQKEAPDAFTYTMRNVIKDTPFRVMSGRVSSAKHQINVLKKPQMTSFDVQLSYPKYIRRKAENLQNIGDLTVPEGTNIRWNVQTKNTQKVAFSFGNNKVNAEKRGSSSFSYGKRLRQSQAYSIYIKNENIIDPDSISYRINVVKDAYPSIEVKAFEHEGDDGVKYYAGTADDDYGISSLTLKYKITSENGVSQPLQSKIIEKGGKSRLQFKHTIDFETFGLKPGDKLTYYFEVADNDAINGSKKTKSVVNTYEKPSLAQLEEQEAINDEEIKDELKKSIDNLDELRKKYEKMRQDLLQKKELDWKDRKEIQRLLEEQKNIQEKLEKAKEKLDQNIENQENNKPSEDIQKKQERMKELFEQATDPKKDELLEKIEKLLQDMQKENSIEMMEQMDMQNDMLKKDMDRLLELYKKLEVEKEAQKMIEKLDELSKKQEQLADKQTPNEQSKQEQLNKEMKGLQKQMKNLEKQNQDLQRPKDLGEDNDEKLEDILKEMQDAKKSLEEKNDPKATKNQKSAAKKMQKMAESMSSNMEGGDKESNEEDTKLLRQLLENLLTISFEQEEISDVVNKVDILSPQYRKVLLSQKKIKDDFKIVEDSLTTLAMRNDKIKTFVLEKVSEVKYNMDKSIENLGERKTKNKAVRDQRYSMTNINDLALMLAKALDQMNMSGKGKGSGNKNGSGKQPSDKISKAGEELGKKLQQMNQNGKDGNSAKDFAKAAAKLAAMRKALEKMQQNQKENGEGTSPELQQLINDMNRMEIDLVNKRLDSKMLQRQKDIQTRLLQAEKADHKREYDNKRKGKAPKQQERKNPPSLDAYLKERASEIELYKTISPDLRPYYKDLVEKYYEALKK